MSAPNEIILFGYPASVYTHRVVSYLALRGLNYAQCIQPHILPRPDLNSLGIQYRRVPLMVIAGHVYADSRLIIHKLETFFPDGALSSPDPNFRAIERLLERFITDGGIMMRGAALIPPNAPILADPKFTADRKQMTGKIFSPETQAKGRPEALVHMADAMELFESTLLSDGRQWLANTKEPSLADVEGVWMPEWIVRMQSWPKEWEERFPKVFAWVQRFVDVVKQKSKAMGEPMSLTGEQTKQMIFNMQSKEQAQVDENDPLGLKAGDVVTVFPLDTGSANQDTGKLVTLTADEIAIELDTKIILHLPRWNFRIVKAEGTKL